MDIQKGQFETITCEGLETPIVAALDRAGRPLPLAGDLEPKACGHAGAMWSNDLALRCARCGAPMFLPPRFLAYMTAERIDMMYGLWHTAGCPPWYPASVDHLNGSWGIVPRYWRMVDVVGFGQTGGLPVLLAQWQRFDLARRKFAQ